MTALSLLMVVASSLIISAAGLFFIPAIARTAFQAQMLELADELEALIVDRALPRHHFVYMSRTVLYRYSADPNLASLRTLLLLLDDDTVRPSKEIAEAHACFNQVATPAERHLLDEVMTKLVMGVFTYARWNSIFWLPIAVLRLFHWQRQRTLKLLDAVLTLPQSPESPRRPALLPV